MNDDISDMGELPRDFGDYVLLRALGRGGMGQVFLAKVKAKGLVGVDKLCVVKTLRVSNDPEYQRRFVDEARLIVLLTHRNICHVFDAGCFEDQYYLAMEHINGRELRHVQQMAEGAGTPLPVDVAIFVVKEVLEALDAAHRMKHPLSGEPLRVVHRDVSPQNVMLSSEGEVKLIDFGLAESTQKLERTAPRIVMGKMAYMSPEQARGETVDGRADQFAAGVLLYELLANERYYGVLPVDEVWRTSGRGGFQPARLSAIEPALVRVIQKATAPQRDQRYASCGDMRAELQQVELKRGALAGSREVRTAFQDLLLRSGEQMPTASNLDVKPPASSTPTLAPVPTTTPTPPPSPPPSRERTRTFRIRSTQSDVQIEDLAPNEKTEIGFVIEGLGLNELPPALATGDAFRPVSLMASVPSAAVAAGPMPSPLINQAPLREATVVVRSRSPAGAPSDDVRTLPGRSGAPSAFDTQENPRSPKRWQAAAVAVVVAASGGSIAVAADAGAIGRDPAIVVDAGVAAAVLIVPVVSLDAGSADTEGAPTDAGSAVELADLELDPGTDDADAGPRRVRNKQPRRAVPDFPADVKISGGIDLNPVKRTGHLKQSCSDVPCYRKIQSSQGTLTNNELRKLQDQCLAKCRRTAPP